jgi:hypothetical protein
VSPTRPSLLRRRTRIARIAAPIAVVSLVSGALVAGALSTSAAAAPAGTYVIGKKAVALNQATDPEMGRLTPTADAAKRGMYGTLAAWPVVALHATLTRQGELITYGTPKDTVAQAGVVWDRWTPSSGLAYSTHTDQAVMGGYDSFCNAAVTLADGRLLMVSGQLFDGRDADMMTMIYDPRTGAQTMAAGLAYERWYPTALRLTDDRILLLGGAAAGNTGAYATPDDNSRVAFTPEIGTGTGPWRQLTGAASPQLFGALDNRWWYPRAFNAPQGDVVGFSGNAVWRLDPDGNGSVRQVATLPFDPKVSGSQVMYAPGKILIAGGGQVNNDEVVGATNRAAILDVNRGTPTVRSTTPMHRARHWLNLTVLPTGKVFANGGTVNGTLGGADNSVYQSEVWNPKTGTWTLGASAQAVRTYHNTSVLLPSGAVWTGGGGNPGPVDNFNAEIYYPSSLFTDQGGSVRWASRPAISTIAGSATYGGTMKLGVASDRRIASASLITLPSVTHSQTTDQRRIPLTISQKSGTVSAKLPKSVNTMPPGDYQLTVVDSKGVPSASQIITIRKGAAGLVTVAKKAGGAYNANASKGADAGAGTAATSVTLPKGAALTLRSVARAGQVIAHSSTKAVVRKASAKSSKAVKRASSWIVRTGLGSKKGYSLESVDRKGWYLVAPAKGAGTAKLVKKTSSASFAKRATFSAVPGTVGRGLSLRLTASPALYLRVDGAKPVVQRLTESNASHRASSFTKAKGLASR